MGNQNNILEESHEDSKPEALDFIREIIANDLSSGKHNTTITRFPPEPNGYIHIGHAKSICLNFGISKENKGGVCHLRFDDTNPVKEDMEYVDSIKQDVGWLGFEWGENLFFASDYFDKFYNSPRLALKYSGLQSSNIRFTYNRAHQVPSLFHLFGNIYNQNTINMTEDVHGNVLSLGNPENLDVYGNPIETPQTVEQPYVPLFSGNGDGFKLDNSIIIDPLEVEIVDSYEFGIKGMPLKNLFVDFNAYYSKFHNMTSTTQYIQTIYPHGQVPFSMNQLTHVGDQELDKRDILFTYVNLGEVEYLGMDISLEYQLNYRSSIFSTYSYYNTLKLVSGQNETPYVGNDWAWAELVEDSKDVSAYDIMHFNAPNEKVSFGYSIDDFLVNGLYFEVSGKYNSQFDFESGGWNYSEDDQNESYLYSGCG